MSNTLLIQSCSGNKNNYDGLVPAMELYDGYFFRILKKAKRENKLRDDVDIMILSAKHSLIEPDEEISYYDRVMDSKRAEELNQDVLSALTCKLDQKNYDKVVLNLGKTYKKAVDGIEDILSENQELEEITGRGIGEKGGKFKELIRN